MIFQKEFEYTDDAYDAALEIAEKHMFKKLNIVTIAVMAVFLIVLIIVSLISRVYALLIIGLVLIIAAGISYVFRSADLKTFIESYSPEAWNKKYLRRYLVTLYDDRIDIELYEKGSGKNNDRVDGFPPRSEYSYPEEDEFYIGEGGDTEFVLDSRPKEKNDTAFAFDYDPLACRCFESAEAFLIFRRIYDCMPILKDQLTNDDVWVLRSYFSERMGKRFIRMI